MKAVIYYLTLPVIYLVSLLPFWWLQRLSDFLYLLVYKVIGYRKEVVLKNSKLASFIFTLFGYYTLNPARVWKRSHDYHHKHNSKLFSSSIGSFPILTKEQYIKASRLQRINYLFIRHPITIFFGYLFAFWYGMCLLPLLRNPSKNWEAALAIVFHVSIGVSFLHIGGWSTFLISFLIPAFVSSFLGSYLFYAQHNFPGAQFKEKSSWSYADAALYSTSFMKLNRVLHWFTGNIGYHHVHHLNALIPFYRLPEVHEAFNEFSVVKQTTLNPIDMYKCFRVKLWDPAQQKMISLQELT